MSAAIGAWIACLAFWGLLAYGFAIGELRARGVVSFLAAWLAGLVALTHAPYQPAREMFPSFVALLDIVLVFVIFKGDVRLA